MKECVRCRQPADETGLCREHRALRADPVADAEGRTDALRPGAGATRYGYGVCSACRSRFARRAPAQIECDGCRRGDPARRCACGADLAPREKNCGPCRRAAAVAIAPRPCHTCGVQFAPRSEQAKQVRCDPCRWARARGDAR